jgi:hypothetical protein
MRITSMLDVVDVGTWAVDLVNDRVTPDRNLARMFFVSDDEARVVHAELSSKNPSRRPPCRRIGDSKSLR